MTLASSSLLRGQSDVSSCYWKPIHGHPLGSLTNIHSLLWTAQSLRVDPGLQCLIQQLLSSRTLDSDHGLNLIPDFARLITLEEILIISLRLCVLCKVGELLELYKYRRECK
jgi:hypothetical protein